MRQKYFWVETRDLSPDFCAHMPMRYRLTMGASHYTLCKMTCRCKYLKHVLGFLKVQTIHFNTSGLYFSAALL